MKHLKITTIIYIFIFYSVIVHPVVFGGKPYIKTTFPKIAGMNIGAKNYDDSAYQNDLSKCDIVILGFYRGWKRGNITPKDVVISLKTKNPNILVGQYSILNEAYDDTIRFAADIDVYKYLSKQNWWLHDMYKHKVQWTATYSAWELNFTEFAPSDNQGRRYPQWRAERDFGIYFDSVPFDIWYFDNVWKKPRVQGDYKLDGHNDDPNDSDIQASFRRGMAAEWKRARELKSSIFLIGNIDGDLSQSEYVDKLDGGFLEAQMGKTWSLETRAGWNTMMQAYKDIIKNTITPKLVIFNVHGSKNDYKLMRYGIASTLMDNGYFCFSDIAKLYSSVPWFDEYNVSLGVAIDDPQSHAWQKGVYRREFEKGLVLVNPKGNGTQTVNVGSGYIRIRGTQDSVVNNGAVVEGSLTIPVSDGIILIKIISSDKK